MKMSKEQLVEYAWAYALGALEWERESQPPMIEKKTVGKMGLNIGVVERAQGSGKRGGGVGGGGGRGGGGGGGIVARGRRII